MTHTPVEYVKSDIGGIIPLLLPEQAAELLLVKRKTLMNWALEGKVPCVRLSERIVRFRQTDIERIINGQE